MDMKQTAFSRGYGWVGGNVVGGIHIEVRLEALNAKQLSRVVSRSKLK